MFLTHNVSRCLLFKMKGFPLMLSIYYVIHVQGMYRKIMSLCLNISIVCFCIWYDATIYCDLTIQSIANKLVLKPACIIICEHVFCVIVWNYVCVSMYCVCVCVCPWVCAGEGENLAHSWVREKENALRQYFLFTLFYKNK